MYEDLTQDAILKRMLDNVSSDVDKREGSLIYDATAPASIEFFLLYVAINYFFTNTFADTAEREWLIRRAKERGLTPTPASSAKVKATFTPATVDIEIGSSFSYETINFTVTEKVSPGVYYLTCDTAGTVGNVPPGALIPNSFTLGLQTATLTEIIRPGQDEEETEHFRTRYLNSFNVLAYGGNITDYIDKMNSIAGVGGCKVYPVWAGGGTVKLVFMTSEYKVPTEEFVQEVQTMIDPVTNAGQGIGIAPIGHHVTVEGVTTFKVAIELHLTTTEKLAISFKNDIEKIIDNYFTELNKKWPDTKKDTAQTTRNTGITIRTTQIESRILELDGIDDITHTKLNGVEENLVLGINELAVRGEITWLTN